MKNIDKNIYLVETFKQPKNSNECPYYAFANILTYIQQQNFTPNKKIFTSKLNYLKKLYNKYGGSNSFEPNEELELLLKNNQVKLENKGKFLDSYNTVIKVSSREICINDDIIKSDIFLVKDLPEGHCYVVIYKDSNFYILDSIDNNYKNYKHICKYISFKK